MRTFLTRARARVLVRLAPLVCASLPPLVWGQTPNLQNPLPLSGSPIVGPAAGVQQAAAFAAGSGASLLVFEDKRAGDLDLFGVRLDASGAPIDALPFPIAKDPGDQSAPKVAWNGTSWLVAYKNQVDPGSGYFAYQFAAKRVAANGTVLDGAPIPVFQDSTGGTFGVASDGAGWAVVTTGYSAGNNGIFARRISGGGILLDPSPVVVWPGSYYIVFGLEASFAGGQYLFTWTDNGLRGARFTQSLQALDPSPVLLPAGAGSVTANGNEYFVAWSRQTPIFTSEVVGQRVALDLSAVGPAPISISGYAAGANHVDPRAVWDGTQWIVSWLTSGTQNARVARVTRTGAVLDPGGDLVPDGSKSYLYHHALGALPAGGALIAWDDARHASSDLFGVPFGGGGAMGSESCYALGSEAQKSPRVAAGPGQHLVTYRAELSTGTRVLAQRVGPLGHALDVEPIEVAAASHQGLYAGGAAWNGSLYLVAWTDTSQGRVFGRRLSAQGSWIDPAPFPVLLGSGADVAALGDDFLVTALRAPSYPEYVFSFGARVRGSDGAVLDDPALAIGPSYATRARITTLGGRWLVVTESHWTHDENPANLMLNFVDASGAVTPGVNAGTLNIQGWGIVDIASSGTSAIVVGQSGSNWTNTDVYARRILPDGSMPAAMKNLTGAVGRGQSRPAIAWSGSEYVVAYETYENNVWFYDYEPDVYAVRLAEDGTQLDPAGHPAWDGEDWEERLDGAGLGEGKALVAASTYVDGEHAAFRVALVALRPDGLASYGAGTPGCDGAQHLDANGEPVVGSGAFAIRCDRAPLGGAGFVLLATAADEAGSDPFALGIALHVDLLGSAFTLVQPVVADANGLATLAQPLPSNPAFAGTTFHAQAAFYWKGPCSPSSSGFSTSDGLHVTLQL